MTTECLDTKGLPPWQKSHEIIRRRESPLQAKLQASPHGKSKATSQNVLDGVLPTTAWNILRSVTSFRMPAGIIIKAIHPDRFATGRPERLPGFPLYANVIPAHVPEPGIEIFPGKMS